MRDIELEKEERFIEADETWRRIAKHLNPNVRKDIVGWINPQRASQSPLTSAVNDTWSEFLNDVLLGFSLVCDPLPLRKSISSKTDLENIASDWKANAGDMWALCGEISRVVEEEKANESDQGAGQESQKDNRTII